MPAKCFHIGDLVHCRKGLGYIMGLQHQRYIGNPDNIHLSWYCIGIAQHEGPDKRTSDIQYLTYDTEPTLMRPSTPDTIRAVQTQAAKLMSPHTSHIDENPLRRLHPGDLIKNPYYGNGIILSDPYIRQDWDSKHLAYHVYYFDKNIFDFDCANNGDNSLNLHLWRQGDNATRKIANQIIFDCYLSPIYSVNPNEPIAEFSKPQNLYIEYLQDKITLTERELDIKWPKSRRTLIGL